MTKATKDQLLKEIDALQKLCDDFNSTANTKQHLLENANRTIAQLNKEVVKYKEVEAAINTSIDCYLAIKYPDKSACTCSCFIAVDEYENDELYCFLHHIRYKR